MNWDINADDPSLLEFHSRLNLLVGYSSFSIHRDENEEMKKQLKKCVNWRGRRSRASGGRVWEGG